MIAMEYKDKRSDLNALGLSFAPKEIESTDELPDVLPSVLKKPSLNSAEIETRLEDDSTSFLAPQPEVSPLVSPQSRALLPLRRFKPLQQWEGLVTDVGPDSFWAELIDLNDSTKANEIAEILLAEISPSDRPLLVPGCIFYWSIGYDTSSGGQIRNTSEIRVRRNPIWSRLQLDRMKKAGHALFTEFKLER